eukprot:Seg4595.4 transcript_id=Seg4595.4/GoldUCD/mRNA.D3Y31 product="hypothetical protein" protein_id=Seg4595.4/GoldUCD/D3Y31
MNGLRYGMKSKPSHQLTSGKTVTYKAVNVLKALSGSSDEEEVKMLFKEIAHQRPDLLPTCNPTKISVADAVNLKALTRLSMNKAERKIREREMTQTQHVSSSSVEGGMMNLKRTATCDNTSSDNALDIIENMWKVHDYYNAAIHEVQTMEIDGRKVRAFLGGDFNFIDDMLGHQGSAATFPISTDLVTLAHLRNHGGKPHNPDHCQIEVRTQEHYSRSYNENLCDDRNNRNLRENGKFHYNVFEKMLFPLKDLRHVVPPILHILLGITLLIYNLLLEKCRSIDEEEFPDLQEKENDNVELEWEKKSLELSEQYQEMEILGESMTEMENRMERFEAVIAGDKEENIRITREKKTTNTRNMQISRLLH